MGYSIGIDLGTSNSVACVVRRGKVETIPVEGRATLPSVVSVRPDGTELTGQAAKRRAMVEPSQSMISAKRFIGDEKTEWILANKVYTPVTVSSLILQRLKEAAAQHLSQSVTEAVITVPAYFDNNQRRATMQAGEAAGLQVLQLIPEPTAAAVSYGLDKGKDQTLLVYDLGGGTFDVSVLSVKGNKFQVVAVDGDSHLGGDDLDLLLVEYFIGLIDKRSKKARNHFRNLFRRGDDSDSRELLVARQRLKEEAEKAKIELSEADRTHVTIPEILGTSLDEEITLDEYNRMISPLIDRTTKIILEVLRSARVTADDIDRVILVGGSTRNRLVKSRVAEAVKEPWTSERADEVVGQGAAILASYLSSPEEDLTPIEIQNVTPFSLGVCSESGLGDVRLVNSIIIHTNSPVPCLESRAYEVRTRSGKDNKLEVYMLQGESENPEECLALGRYSFSGVAHGGDGRASVEIEYGYDESGIITASARDTGTDRILPLAVDKLTNDPGWLDRLAQDSSGKFDPSELKLIVTPEGYDDVAQVLTSLQLPYGVYDGSDEIPDCDIFFWNCLAPKHPTLSAVVNYVRSGGCLYASCCAAEKLGDGFTESIRFDHSGCRSEVIRAKVVDAELTVALGKTLKIEYDEACCYTISYLGSGGEVLLKEKGSDNRVMAMVPFGAGHIFYTCFHHHDHLSKKEKRLLQLLVMKQISVVSGMPIQAVSEGVRRKID